MKKRFGIFFFMLYFFVSVLSGQTEKINLAGKHSIFIEGGFKTNSQISVVTNMSGVETKAGFVGGINYGYWFDDEWSLTASVGVFGVSTSSSYNGVETSAITPVLFGMRYYPAKFSMGSVGRVYFGLAAGPYVGHATKTESGFLFRNNTGTVSEAVFGMNASFGIDLFVTSWFKFGPRISYHLLDDFSEVIGTKKNLSGGSFSIDFGLVL